MSWNYIKDKLPHTYITGDFDGKKSDEVLAEDINGKRYIAVVYSGFIDGSEFNDWYNNNDYDINTEILRWMEIPY